MGLRNPCAVQGLFSRMSTTSDYEASRGFRGFVDENDFSSVVGQSVTSKLKGQ